MITQQEITDEYVEGFFNLLQWADGFLFIALLLIIADLFFGVKAAKKRGDDVRRSRALRRTIDKGCSYILWILIAYSLGEVFGKYIDAILGQSLGSISLPFFTVLIIYFIEIESVFKNYFEWRGVKAKINLLKFLTKKTDGIIEYKKEEDAKNKEDEKDK